MSPQLPVSVGSALGPNKKSNVSMVFGLVSGNTYLVKEYSGQSGTVSGTIPNLAIAFFGTWLAQVIDSCAQQKVSSNSYVYICRPYPH